MSFSEIHKLHCPLTTHLTKIQMAYRRYWDQASLPLFAQVSIPGFDHSIYSFLAKIHGTGTVVIFVEAELSEAAIANDSIVGKPFTLRDISHKPVVYETLTLDILDVKKTLKSESVSDISSNRGNRYNTRCM